MTIPLLGCRTRVALCSVLLAGLAVEITLAQNTPPQFGGAYSQLEPRRQRLVENWAARFMETTGQKLEVGPFYDEIMALSSKTTFDAVTHALMTTRLTDASGVQFGDALSLVEQVESVRGQIVGAASDRQFRMYVRLTSGALDALARSREFKRGADNTVYHKGYPTSYRQQGGIPSIQISIARDGRRADIDVDYRSAYFPAVMFNGHLSASNSDVRAGNNSDRHADRWAGFRTWWGSLLGSRSNRPAAEKGEEAGFTVPRTPRAGKKSIEVMVQDFLHAWLVEGDVVAALGYVSNRSAACLAQDIDDPAAFDRGMAPFQLMMSMKAAQAALGARTSLEGLTVGIRLSDPALRVVRQPHHAQFVVYSVPDDVAARFDCESRLTLADTRPVRRTYGNYFGATFFVDGRKNDPLALLWARENGYWKVVSWQAGVDERDTPVPDPPSDITVARIAADASLVEAARGFLDSWLIKKDYDAAFRVLSPESYACYDLGRGPDQPASTSPADAGRRIRAALEQAGTLAGKQPSLDALLSAVEPIHPSVRLMDHRYARTFSLTSLPTALADAAQCAARARGEALREPIALEYGTSFGLTVRFRTRSGEPAVLRLLWRKDEGVWRITSYDVEVP